jgi:transposase
MARPHGITQQIVTQITTALRLGVPKEAAAAVAGVPRRTFFTWLEKGREPLAEDGSNQVYIDFADACDLALEQGKANLLGIVAKAATGGKWQAACWILERRWPNEFGAKQRIDIGGQDGTPAIKISGLERAPDSQSWEQRYNPAVIEPPKAS